MNSTKKLLDALETGILWEMLFLFLYTDEMQATEIVHHGFKTSSLKKVHRKDWIIKCLLLYEMTARKQAEKEKQVPLLGELEKLSSSWTLLTIHRFLREK